MADFSSIRFLAERPLLRELSADRLNSILTEIRRNRPKGERGITVRQSGDGTYIGLAAALPTATGTSNPPTPQPWDLIANPDPNNENQYLVSVRPGTLNSLLASNWDQVFTVADSGLFYAKAVVSTDGEAVTSLAIQIDDQAPQLQQPVLYGIESSVEFLFGLFSAGSTYRVINNGNINVSPKVWLVTESTTTAGPGESPYDIYYLLA